MCSPGGGRAGKNGDSEISCAYLTGMEGAAIDGRLETGEGVSRSGRSSEPRFTGARGFKGLKLARWGGFVVRAAQGVAGGSGMPLKHQAGLFLGSSGAHNNPESSAGRLAGCSFGQRKQA